MNDRYTVPGDAVALRMENDLLTLEVEHLRGVAAEVRSALAEAEAARAPAETSGTVQELTQELRATRRELARAERIVEIERGRVAELARARSDLRWLLERLDGSPARPLLRRFGGYRALVERWLPA